MFQRNNGNLRKGLDCKSSNVASNHEIISIKGYSVPRDFSWTEIYKLRVFIKTLIKTSSRGLKTSSEPEDERRLQDVLKTSSSRRLFAGGKLIANGGVQNEQESSLADTIIQKNLMGLIRKLSFNLRSA